MKLNLLSFMLPCLLVMMSTQSCDDVKLNNEKEVLCTMDFRSVFVFVEDTEGNPFLLDSIRSAFDGEELIAQGIDPSVYSNFPPEEPFGYPVVDDTWQEFFKGRTEDVEFKGFRNGEEVVSGLVKVTADECHVSSPESDQVLVASYIEPVFCTEEFRTISVFVKDNSGNPYALDSITTTWNDEVLIAEKVSNEYRVSEGVYFVIDDSLQKLFENKTDSVLFKGFKEQKEVVSGMVKVGADRCHVYSPEEMKTFVVSE